MKTKTLKIMITILMAITCLCTVSQVVLAGAEDTGNSWDITPVPPSDMGSIKNVAGKIIGLIQAASGIAAVVLIAVFGFKFIMGSANEKADYQKSFIPLIVGVVVVFASSGIANLIFTTFANTGSGDAQ